MSVEIKSARLADTTARLQTNDLNLEEYIEKSCDRLDAVDDDLHAFVPEPDRRDRLHADSEQLLSTYPDENDRPPLFGIPVGIKDIIHVDGLETRAGTAVPPELFAGPEATCVTQLRDAGAPVLGKTITTEFAGFAPGLTRNPHNLDHTPGGSSSGSAAAVAAGLVPLALGTQTGGSVIRPAAFCGIVGMKPSYQRIPRDGVIERSVSADHVGMYTQDIEGMHIAASILCDDWDDPDPIDEELPTLGVPEGNYLEQASDIGRTAFADHIAQLNDAGCTIKHIEVPTFNQFQSLLQRHNWLHFRELADVHENWYDEYKAFYRTPTAEHIEAGKEVTDAQLEEAKASRLQLRNELETLMDDHTLDLWTAPSARGPAPKTIKTTGSSIMNRPWTHSGLPVVSLPAGTASNELPLGIKFISRFNDDETLLAWATTLNNLL